MVRFNFFFALKVLMTSFLDLDPTRPVQGISYLKKAAEQGHEMALELLGACYRTRKGIVSSNESEIRKFLEMSPSERAARLAAQELFNSLANGNTFVTVEQLQNRMREIYKMQKRKKSYDTNNENSLKENSDEEEVLFEVRNEPSTSSAPLRVQSKYRHDDEDHISEANLLNAAHNYSNGRIPSINQALTLSVPHPQTLENVPFFHRPFFHPSIFFALLYYRFIDILSSISFESLKKFQILFLLAIYAVVSSGNILTSIPSFAFYASLIIMIIASCKMLKSKHQFIDFRIWSGLFLSYNDRVYADESESLFLRKNLQPYVWFFLSFATNLMVYPLLNDQWLPHSEITVVGVVLTFVTLICFIRTSGKIIDLTVFLSFTLNIFAKYPYDLDSFMSNKYRLMKLSETSFMLASGIELTMNYRGLLYVAISFLMLLLARRENWRGIYQFLFPHCVTLAWLQIAIINSQSATAFALIRSALGVVGIFFFVPIFGLLTLLIPVLAGVEFIAVKDSTNRIFITISTTLIAIVTSFMAASRRSSRYVTYVQIMVCVLAVCFLFRPHVLDKLNERNIYSSSYLQQSSTSMDIIETDSNILSWDVYHKYCVINSNSNRIPIQLRCSHLYGSHIHWEGTVVEVGISQIKNWQRDIIQNLPDIVGNFLTCYFGDRNQLDCFERENCEIKEFIESQKRCNLDKWNIYKYEIEIKMSSSSSSSGGLFLQNTRHETKIILEVDHAFGNFTSQINSSDKIWFKGTLKAPISNDHLSCKYRDHEWKIPRVELNSVGCILCADKTLSSTELTSKYNFNSYIKEIKRGIKYGLNQLFYPLITFK